MSDCNKVLLGYWDLRGLAEPIRLLLEYCEIPYEQKLYVCGDGPEFSRADWTQVKDNLPLHFPNLPYFRDKNGMYFTESWAIMQHIARKHELVPKDEISAALCDQLQGVVQDFRKSFTNMCYSTNYEKNKDLFLKQLPEKMKRFNVYLTEHAFLAGKSISYVDFALAEILDQVQMFYKDLFNENQYSAVNNYLNKILNLPNIKSYRKSSRFKKFPCNNKRANWGGKKEDNQ